MRNPLTKEVLTAAFKVEAQKDALSFAQVVMSLRHTREA